MHKFLKFILGMKLYMFQTVPLSIIRSFSLDQDGTAVPSWSCSQAVSKPVWHIPLLCVQWKTPDDGRRNCPKHIEFHSKNIFEKFVHLVGFIIRNFIAMHGHMNVKLYENAFFICLNLVISSKYFTCTIHAYVLSIFNNQHSIIAYYSCLCFHSKRGTCNPSVCWENSVSSHLSRASFFHISLLSRIV